MFQKALALDARYAVAHSYRAFVKVAQHGHASTPIEVLEAASTEAKQASTPLESRCHRILSTICLYRREYDKAEQNMRQASHLNPNDEDVMSLKGRVGLAGDLLIFSGAVWCGADNTLLTVRHKAVSNDLAGDGCILCGGSVPSVGLTSSAKAQEIPSAKVSMVHDTMCDFMGRPLKVGATITPI